MSDSLQPITHKYAVIYFMLLKSKILRTFTSNSVTDYIIFWFYLPQCIMTSLWGN